MNEKKSIEYIYNMLSRQKKKQKKKQQQLRDYEENLLKI